MNENIPHPVRLGVVRTVRRSPERVDVSHDGRFRREIAGMVQEILLRHFDYDRVAAHKQAYRRMISLEQLVATRIAELIMDKVDAEYV